MNKNSKRKFDAAADAFGRVKHSWGGEHDQTLSANVGWKKPLDAHPKVGRSAAEISKRIGR